MSDEHGVRIHVSLPNHVLVSGETFRADPVGDDLYRLANVPFYAYGLNYRDVVRATPDSEGITTIREVVRPSGYRTLRVFFDDALDRGQQDDLLNRVLVPKVVSAERADDLYVSITVSPEGDYLAVFNLFDAWADEGHLGLETCHAREEGSFDDSPPDENE